MATYYVQPNGSNSNTGLGASNALAWQTVQYALTSASGFASGDTLNVSPGVYTLAITVTITNPTAETIIIGDPTSSLFSSVPAGPVIITNYNSALSGTSFTGNIITATSKNYLHFQNIQFKIDNNKAFQMTTSTNLKLTKCSFISRQTSGDVINVTSPSSTALNFTMTRCVCVGGSNFLSMNGGGVTDSSSITDSIFMRAASSFIAPSSVQIAISNCTFFGGNFAISTGAPIQPITVRNCLFFGNGIDLVGGTAGTIVENYNRLLSNNPRNNVTDNLTSSTSGDIGLDFFETLLQGLTNVQPFTSYLGSQNTNFGNSTGAPLTDLYGVAWTGAKPDAGSATFRVINTIGTYLPSERNASTIRIAPGSTSQSIELFLGVTGLTSSTSGLTARYNRTRTASVNIPLVARTIAQAWISGGFAEVDATNMPGVYRIDLPDAALSLGADDVTVVVRGASGTNGAVMTVTLSTGDNTGAGDVSGNILEITEDPQEVTNISAWVGDWHTYVVRLVDDNGTPYDITNDTLSVTYTDVATGSAYSFVSGTAAITKQMNAQGIISILNPAAYPTAAVIRITIGATIGTTVRRFGPLEIEVLAP